MGKRYSKKSYRSVYAGQHQTITSIEQLTTEQNSIVRLCELFNVARSSYHYYLKNRGKVNPEHENLQDKATQTHKDSRACCGYKVHSSLT
jgi:hypothetical protein